MSKIDNPLAAANHLLAHREAFQQWSLGRTARWHKTWLASSRTKYAMGGVLVAAILGATAGINMALIGLAPPSAIDLDPLLAAPLANPILAALGFLTFFVSVTVFGGVVTDDFSVKTWFNPLLNRESKRYGVWFKTHQPGTLWGECSQHEKTRLLSNMAQLDESWTSVKASVLPLINADLPYVWWQQMEHIIEWGLKHQRASTYQTQIKNEFVRVQTQIESQIQSPVSVNVETEMLHSSPNKANPTNVVL